MAGYLLLNRDWVIDPISAGVSREDILATDPDGVMWSVEVKNCVNITKAHRQQAMEQAKARKLPWMLMNKIDGTKFWLIQRAGKPPILWAERGTLI